MTKLMDWSPSLDRLLVAKLATTCPFRAFKLGSS